MDGIYRIKTAFLSGGPLVSCWNVNGGWNLNQQVQWIKEGVPYAPTIFCPTIAQRANKDRTWDEWYPKYADALKFINDNELPVTLRWHNWGADHYLVEPRKPFDESALVFRVDADGNLNDGKLLCPLAPILPWRLEGEAIATSYWIARLAEVLPNVPRLYWLENNESALAELGFYTEPLTTKDQWGHRHRAWKSNLQLLSVRMAEWAMTHDANDCEAAIKDGFVKQRQAMTNAMKANAPAVWSGKIYTGGYGGLGTIGEAGLNNQKYSYKRPQENWASYPYAPEAYQFDEASERCYDDGSGSPWNWHDWVRGPHVLQQNLGLLNRRLEANNPLWHNDQSFWISPTRCIKAHPDHGGYVLPKRVKGFARACLWADRPRHSAKVFRWFADSQEELTNKWFANESAPPELQAYTYADYFQPVIDAVKEVWDNHLLAEFWRYGEPILNTDPALCDWELPPDVFDDRSRTLYTDADPPRYTKDSRGKTIDTWRASDGKVELKVFAQGWRMGSMYLIYAWSPRQTRTKVTVNVPGYGGVLFDTVDQDGDFRIVGAID